MKSSRRVFLGTAALATAGTLSSFTPNPEKKMLLHHVFFWLKNPASTDDRSKLIEGLRTLNKIESVRELHIGVPADTEKRPVVENSYGVSELMLFDDLAGQAIYQEHPIHKIFVENYSTLWEKVVVFDSLDV